jgi:hypothetical protein
MFGLISLPYEVLQNIVENISFDDAVNLGRTCKGFTFLHNEERICKAIVQVRVVIWLRYSQILGFTDLISIEQNTLFQ